MAEKKKFEVPVSGSLGLLATGYVGLVAWRQKRKELRVSAKASSAGQGTNQESEKDNK